MPRLAPEVHAPVRVRGRHVVIAGVALAYAIVALAHRVCDSGSSRRAVAREVEGRFLDGLAPRSLTSCPALAELDPWGDAYQVLCHEDAGRVQVVVVSYGDGEAITASRAYPE